MKIVKRKRRKPKKDVVGQGRRWAGWRGLYTKDLDHLNGPVRVRKLEDGPVEVAESPSA